MKLTTRLAAALAAALAFASLHAISAPTLDTTFGGTGIVIGPPAPPGGSSFPHEGLVADRHEGAVFVREINNGVTANIDLVRLRSDGTVDAAFGGGGAASVTVVPAGEFVFTALALDRRRLLVAYGTSSALSTSFSVRRYSEDGVADAAFGAGGVVTIPAEFLYPILDVQAQSDRKVLVVGGTTKPGDPPLTQQITLYRLTEAGVLDATFGVGGVVYTAVPGGTGNDQGTGVRVQPDGKIVVAGRSRQSGETDAVAVRYLSNGALDPAFGAGGIAKVSFGSGSRANGRRLSIQSDGKIVVTGTILDAAGMGRAGLFRLNDDGTLDVGFGVDGMSAVALGANGGLVYEIVQQPDERPVIVGHRYRTAGDTDLIAIALRYTAFGTLDTTWDGDGLYELLPPGFTESNGDSIAIDDHDRILISGALKSGTDTRWFVARLKTGKSMVCKP